MVCKLCNTEKEKLCKAHLIPESFYRFMYPDNIVQGDALRVVMHNVEHLKRSRIGLYDDSILCATCDQLLGQLDEYGKEMLLDCSPRAVSDSYIDLLVLENVDVAKLILFFLSVLWRFSISTRQEVVKISIGSKFESKIRDLLYQNKGTLSDFPIVITRYKYQNDNYKKMFFLPKPLKLEGINYYYVYFPNGYKILIKVDSRIQLSQLEPLTLKASQPVYVTNIDYFENTDEFVKTSIRVKNLSKF